MSAQSALIAAARAGHTQHAGVLVHSCDGRKQERIEDPAVLVVLAGFEQVPSRIR